jgi:mannose-6-phosphate isomerase-like protein (cupin superfamily)
MSWQTASPKPVYDVLAPDGSEIRLLVQLRGGSLVHCTLQPGRVTRAVVHRSVEEVWYCVAGRGQLWRGNDEQDEVTSLGPGVAVTIPVGTRFQFRASADRPLVVVITTLPPWPGADEAVPVAGPWPPTGLADDGLA